MADNIPPTTPVPMSFWPARPRSGGDRQREDAGDEGDGRHQDRPQAQARAFQGGVQRRLALPFRAFGEFDDQDGVLGRQAHGGEKPDLEEDVVGEAAQGRRQTGRRRSPSGMTRITATGTDQLS